MKRILIFLLLILSVGCSREPSGDEFTGVWSDGGNHRLEFLAPNAVIWQKYRPGTRRFYKDKNDKRIEETVTAEAVRFGLYEKDGNELKVYWVSKVGTAGYIPETTFDLNAVEKDRLEIETEDERWNDYSFKGEKQPLSLMMKRSQGSLNSTSELKGVWRSEDSGVRVIDSLGHSVTFRKNSIHRYQEATVVDARFKTTTLNPFPDSPSEVWYWRKSGSELSLLSQRQMDRKEGFDKAAIFGRCREPLKLNSGGALKFKVPSG